MSMKKLLTLIIPFVIIFSGCSKNTDGDITIVCDGEKIIRVRNGNMWDYSKTVKSQREYVFVDKKLHPYDCSWTERNIICNSVIKDDSLSVVINLDREKGEVAELFTIRNKDGTGTFENFTGKCKKLDKKF